MTTLSEARARVRAARTLVMSTCALGERDAWREELDALRRVEESLTRRLNERNAARRREAAEGGAR